MNKGLSVSRTLEPSAAGSSHGVARKMAVYAGLSLLAAFTVGCAGLHPIEGISADCLPPELNQAYRSQQQTIDLSLLGQDSTREYHVDSGDILAVYIQGVLGGGEKDTAPPVNFQPDVRRPSSSGYPVQVRSNGALSLPLVKSINVRGLTVSEVEDLIRKTYTEDNKILQPGREHILVSLHQPRMYRVMVLRDEQIEPRHNSLPTYGYTTSEPTRRGQVVELPALENDVLHALANSGGLPNLDAESAVYIIRRNRNDVQPGQIPPAPAASPEAARDAWRLQSKKAKKSAAELASTMIQKTNKVAPGKGKYASQNGAIKLVNANDSSANQTSPNDEWWRTSEPTLRHKVEEFWKLSKPVKQAPQEPWWEEKTSNRGNGDSEIQTMAGEEMAQADTSWAEPQAMEMPVSDGRVTAGPTTFQTDDSTILNPHVVRIPLRLTPGEVPNFKPEDVILQDGDVIFIEPRADDFFYTSGLLGGGQYALPRDYDLDLLGAMSIVQAQVNTNHHSRTRSVGGNSVLNQDVSVGASKVIIRRKTCDNNVVNIEVDLHDAVRSPENRVFIQPGDYVILQYTKPEAVLAWGERFVLEPFLSAVSFGALQTN